MSSRTGNVITGESLLAELTQKALAKIQEHESELSNAERETIAQKIAVAAFKYGVLKQSIGRDVIFDPEQSISFEGDSGPYLQYTYVRAKALVAKAKAAGIDSSADKLEGLPEGAKPLQRLLYRLPEIVQRAATDYAPQYLATYLTAVASQFNHWYAGEKIIDPANKDVSSANVALASATSWILKNGLWLLGIEAPERM
jgi:arginyl-tRNA synthetase